MRGGKAVCKSESEMATVLGQCNKRKTLALNLKQSRYVKKWGRNCKEQVIRNSLISGHSKLYSMICGKHPAGL